MTKRLSLLFLICILSALNTNAEVYEGSCGANLRYSLDTETGILKITGTGEMTYNPLWRTYESYIKTVEISNGVTSICSLAFADCFVLASVSIGNNVTSIGMEAFSGCSVLTSITIPNSVTSIGDRAFIGCKGLTSVTIPNSVTSIGSNSFGGCYFENKDFVNFSSLDASANNYWGATFVEDRSFGYIAEDGVLTKFYGNQTTFIVPDDITSIGDGAFSLSYNLTSLTIPKNVTKIGYMPFRFCTGEIIINCVLPATSSLEYLFKYNEYSSVKFGNEIKTIGNSIFKGSSNLSSITIGSNVETIEDNAFANIPKLEKIYCYAEDVPTTSRHAFENSYIDYVTLYVPASSIDAYKSTAPWKNAAQILPLEDYKEKCATPTIIFENGKLSFSCETEDVKYVYNFSTPSESDEDGKGINTPDKLQLSVYAKKDGFENSDVATKEIDLGTSGIRGDLNGDGIVSMPDAMFIVNKILNGKFPDEDIELEKVGVRFGFYEDVPGYSVKINKLNVSGLRASELGSVGSTLKESNSDLIYDKPDGSFTNVYFKDANDISQMVVEVDYTLTPDDGTGETFTGKSINNVGLQGITQWEPNKNYTFIFKVIPTYLYILNDYDYRNPTFYLENVIVEGQDGSTR